MSLFCLQVAVELRAVVRCEKQKTLHPTFCTQLLTDHIMLRPYLYTCGALLLCFTLALTTATDAQAQDTPEPQRYENVDWNNVVMVDFKPGKRGRALEIIREHYVPASEEAGTSMPVMIEMMSGEYDIMLVWMMDDGPSEMTWERSPRALRGGAPSST